MKRAESHQEAKRTYQGEAKSHQAMAVKYRPFGKCVNRPHEITIPNEMHQFDLLYMPSNILYRNKYK